ncbi:MAG: ADP-ribosylglycohydrolase family protein, partial [Longimicrobiales bacterium]
PQPTIDGVIDGAVAAHLGFAEQREGRLWWGMRATYETGASPSNWRYDPNLKFLTEALKIAREVGDPFAIQEPLYEALEWGHLFSEATHTLVVPFAMFVAAGGDFRDSVVGSVMYGRDNDSYATIAGALAGAFHGVDAIPPEWIGPVVEANPEVDMHALAVSLTELVSKESTQLTEVASELDSLAKPSS